MSERPFEDQASPCTCPPEVVRWLQLAVDYVKAGAGNSHPEMVRGAQDVKTFMEQPAEVWCAYVSVDRAEAGGQT